MTATEAIRVRTIANGYRDMAVSLRREAFLKRTANQPLNARIIEEWARIVRGAARAEEIDPEPRED